MRKLDEVGIDAICERIQNLETMTGIALSLGMKLADLQYWLAKDDCRSARMREARASTAQHHDDAALKFIIEAEDGFALAKAKEAAHHLRWRASKIAPRDYGDRQQVEINDVTPRTPEQVDARLAEIYAKAAKAAAKKE